MKVVVRLQDYKNNLVPYLTKLEECVSTLKEGSFNLINKKIQLHKAKKHKAKNNLPEILV
jgi:hypothetical protein